MNRALLDTSFVISLARGEELALDDPPAEAAISSVTLCALHHGVLIADDEQRAGRLATLAYAERRFAVLAVDSRVAPTTDACWPTCGAEGVAGSPPQTP